MDKWEYFDCSLPTTKRVSLLVSLIFSGFFPKPLTPTFAKRSEREISFLFYYIGCPCLYIRVQSPSSSSDNGRRKGELRRGPFRSLLLLLLLPPVFQIPGKKVFSLSGTFLTPKFSFWKDGEEAGSPFRGIERGGGKREELTFNIAFAKEKKEKNPSSCLW